MESPIEVVNMYKQWNIWNLGVQLPNFQSHRSMLDHAGANRRCSNFHSCVCMQHHATYFPGKKLADDFSSGHDSVSTAVSLKSERTTTSTASLITWSPTMGVSDNGCLMSSLNKLQLLYEYFHITHWISYDQWAHWISYGYRWCTVSYSPSSSLN